MKDVVIEVENVVDGCEVRKFSSGVSELWVNGEKKSYGFSKIGRFEYDEVLDDFVAFVEIKLGRTLSLSDRLVGIMNIKGKMLSPLYSERYDTMLNEDNFDNIDKAVDSDFRKLLIDSRAFDDKNKKSREKMKCLVKMNYFQKNKA